MNRKIRCTSVIRCRDRKSQTKKGRGILVLPLRHATVEVHRFFPVAPHLESYVPHPKKKIWRKKKVLPDEQSQVFSIQRKMLQRQDRNCDDFALRSPVIHKQFQPKTCYLYRITPPMAYRVDNGGSIAVVPDSGGSIAVVTPGGSATWWVSSFFRSHSCTPLFVKVVIIQLHVAPEVCACSSRWTVLSTRRHPAHPASALVLNPR